VNNFLNTVPRPVRFAAGVIFCLVVLVGVVVGSIHCAHSGCRMPFGPLGGLFFGLLLGIFSTAWLLCLGYVFADARRRSMPPVLWVLVAMLVPNLLGFLLYFAMRRPIGVPCPRCGRPVAADQRFCSWCGYEVASFAPPPAPPTMGSSPAV
jgi:hypothetical protein